MVKNSPANTGDTGLILGSGGSPGERNGNPLQYSCVGNPMELGGLQFRESQKESDTTYQLNNNKRICPFGFLFSFFELKKRIFFFRE